MDFVEKIKNNKHRAVPLLLGFLLFFISQMMANGMVGPNTFGDETGYLGIARFLANFGTTPVQYGSVFYYFGYALFLIPSFLMFSDPGLIYQSVLFTNSLLLILTYFILFLLVKNLLYKNSMIVAAVISFVVCCFPSFLLQTNFAMSENAFNLVFVCIIFSIYRLAQESSYKWLVIFSFLCGFIYAIHGKGIVFVPISIAFLFVLLYMRKINVIQATISILIIILLYLLFRNILELLYSILYHNPLGETDLSSGLTITLGNKIRILLSSFINHPYAFVIDFFSILSGRVWYLCISSFGLCAIGTYYLTKLITLNYKKDQSEKADERMSVFIVSLFILAVGVGIVLLTTLDFCTGLVKVRRADHIIYGRYNECILPVFIAFGLACLFKIKAIFTKAQLIIMLLSIISFVFLLLCTIYNNFGDLSDNNHPFYGFIWGAAYLSNPAKNKIFLYALTMVSITGMSAFAFLCFYNKKALAVLFLIFAFLYITNEDYKNIARYYSYHTGKLIRNKSLIIKDIIDGKQVCYYYWESYPGWVFYGLQYWLPNVKFVIVDDVKDVQDKLYIIANEKYCSHLTDLGYKKVDIHQWCKLHLYYRDREGI